MNGIKATHIFSGQKKRYGDFYRTWEIETDRCRDEVLGYCFSNLYKREIPKSAEYHANIRYGAECFNDPAYYFAGYYTLKETELGYVFTVVEPYAD